ncbi:hypothetical protein DSLASN_25830 [Desulfoluna limicola]|uniref:Uncharacterized protein n=1 Tax=Desulfoluna limicola TaxID=2810562 RepID=A0ABN6F603_9BACT|nr:hypothetical protein [Desulfoluna limicola]BCS96951.1 hypothetical protein DSLASN_25830 [Desulfoluna limicola]
MYPGSQFNFPWSGDVVQRIDPDFFFGAIPEGAGIGEIEKEVFKVASYGKQLGLITEVLLTLTEEAKLTAEPKGSLRTLKDIHAKIEEVKKKKKDEIRKNARSVLEKLKASDEGELKKLLNDYKEYM